MQIDVCLRIIYYIMFGTYRLTKPTFCIDSFTCGEEYTCLRKVAVIEIIVEQDAVQIILGLYKYVRSGYNFFLSTFYSIHEYYQYPYYPVFRRNYCHLCKANSRIRKTSEQIYEKTNRDTQNIG